MQQRYDMQNLICIKESNIQNAGPVYCEELSTAYGATLHDFAWAGGQFELY